MAPNTQPIFPKTIIHWQKKLTNEVVARDPGAGVPVLFGSAGANGALIHAIYGMALGTNVDTVLRIYMKTSDVAGYFLLLEHDMGSSADPGGGAQINRVDVAMPFILPGNVGSGVNMGMHIPAGASIYAALGTNVAAGWIIHMVGGDY